MDIVIVSSFGILALVAILFSIIAVSNPAASRLGLKNIKRRSGSAISVVLSLSVVAAVLVASLTLGDSVRNTMDEQANSNLGRVDVAVQGLASFNQSYYSAIKSDSMLGVMTGATAPLFILAASARDNDTGAFSAKASLIGFTPEFLAFGTFYDVTGTAYTPDLSDNETAISGSLARELGARIGDEIRFSYSNPALSIETLFSLKAPQIETPLTIKAIVDDSGLGRFQLGTSGASVDAFVNLEALQNSMGMEPKINTIVVASKAPYAEAGSGAVVSRLKDVISSKVTIFDSGFEISISDHARFDNKKVFFSDRYLNISNSVSKSLKSVSAVSPLCAYLVEGIGYNGSWAAYSIVEGFDSKPDSDFGLFTENATGRQIEGNLKDDEIIITNYTAMKVGAKVGSTVTMQYLTLNNLYSVKTVRRYFKVKYIVDMAGKAKDGGMPPYPGIKGRPIRDWEPQFFELNYSICDQSSFDYWNNFAGAPKAYITLDTARELWGNDLGYLTTLKVKPAPGCTPEKAATDFMEAFNASLDSADAAIIVHDIRAENMRSSGGVAVLTETFVSFGSVVIASALIVSVIFINVAIGSRKREIGIAKALGMRKGGVAAALIVEFGFLAAVACMAGVIIGLAFSFVSVNLVNMYMPQLTGGNIAFHYQLSSLLLGFSAALLVSVAVISVFAFAFSATDIESALRARPGYENAPASSAKNRLKKPRILAVCLVAVLVLSLAGAYAAVRRNDFSATGAIYVFFIAGFTAVLAASGLFFVGAGRRRGMSSAFAISRRNLSRRKRAGWGMLAVTALVVFTMLSLAVYDSAQYRNMDEIVDVQGGGYRVYGETSSPVLFDLNSPAERAAHGVNSYPEDAACVQMLSFGAPGGTCTNLRNSLPPRLIGADLAFENSSRMRFYSSANHDAAGARAVWKDLDGESGDGPIPVIGDYNTVIWIMGKNLGDRVEITDEHGASRQIVIVAILENTIFQGSLFVSPDNIRVLYPTRAQYTVFLFIVSAADAQATEIALENSLSAYGMDAKSVADMARANLAVDSAYISIFQSLLAVGLFVGMAGLAALALRGARDRKYEIGVLRAIGFRRATVSGIILMEYILLVLFGILTGIFASLAVSFIIYTSVAVPWLFMAALWLAVLASAFAAVLYPAIKASRTPPAEALRIDE